MEWLLTLINLVAGEKVEVAGVKVNIIVFVMMMTISGKWKIKGDDLDGNQPSGWEFE